MKRVVLLGAAGIVGRDLARQLVLNRDFTVVLADREGSSLPALARELELEGVVVDITSETETARLIRGADLVFNATPYYHNPGVMRACARGAASYMDLGGLYHTTIEQLKLAPEFESIGRLALLGMGKAPGITNILAARGAEGFDELDAVHLRSGRSSDPAPAGLRVPYSPETLLDEFTLAPVVYRDGGLLAVEPLSGLELVEYGAPFGAIEYILTLHSELATLPQHLGRGLRSLEFKVGLDRTTANALQLLVRLGFAGRTPIRAGPVEVSPRDLTVELLRKVESTTGSNPWITEVLLEGIRRGRPASRSLRVTGDERQNGTALAASAAVALFCKGEIDRVGVDAPEAVVPDQAFLEVLQSYGLRFEEKWQDRLERN